MISGYMFIKHEKTKENAIYMPPGETIWERDLTLYTINHGNINESVSLKWSADKKSPEESWNSGGAVRKHRKLHW